MTSSNGNIFRVIGHFCKEFTGHRSPVNSPHKGQWRGALMFFYLRLKKRLSKQSWGWWFETPSRPLWRHCNDLDLSSVAFNTFWMTVICQIYMYDEWTSEQGDICHYGDVIMRAMASQIACVSIVCSTICSGTDQRKHQSSASLAIVRGIHRWPVDSQHKGPVPRRLFPFDDVIMVAPYVLFQRGTYRIYAVIYIYMGIYGLSI